MNYKTIFYTLGTVIGFEAVALLMPLMCALIYGEKDYFPFPFFVFEPLL